MAAVSEYPQPAIVDLRRVRSIELEELLAEEIGLWERRLDWDYRPSADLVRRYVRMQSLGGCALLVGHRVAGYSYWVTEEQKGLIGDLYVSRDLPHHSDFEMRLLDATLGVLWNTPLIRRVESQLMMLSDESRQRVRCRREVGSVTRIFMTLDIRRVPRLEESAAAGAFLFDRWHERDQEHTARLIARSYMNHPDSAINDQYRSLAGARRFLTNVVQYPGCGSFFSPGSLVATDPITGRVAGACLASLVAFDVGHITQICVDPERQGTRLGYELLRQSLLALVWAGVRKVSLTVTSSNEQALRLYRQVGFEPLTSFDAFVWDPERRLA
ncbi:MAG: GNAT family N-acetyltransferase [Bryobacteraceae bacterium]